MAATLGHRHLPHPSLPHATATAAPGKATGESLDDIGS